MNIPFFTIESGKSFYKITTACFLILITGGNLLAQYTGAPVKKERLIKALRSKQLQTRDIVTVIKSNGVDFTLTAETKRRLIAAGARSEVIEAAANNLRYQPKEKNIAAKSRRNNKISRPNKPAPPSFDDLLEQAIFSYKDKRNPKDAVDILENAIKLNPKNPKAYQMMGFIYLYGLNNFAQAEKFMQISVRNGGSAVFRVFHDDNGKFTHRCAGSLYISEEVLRFESDNNLHTFETTMANVDKIKLDRETTKAWKKHSIFKIFLKFGKEKAKFRFAPQTGEEEESKMVGRFISPTNPNGGSALVSTATFPNFYKSN